MDIFQGPSSIGVNATSTFVDSDSLFQVDFFGFFIDFALPFVLILFAIALVVVYFRTGEPFESFICMYFGRRGQGKTVAMVMDIFDWLSVGHVVYTNIHGINWKGIPQKKTFKDWIKKQDPPPLYVDNLHHISFDSKEQFIDFMEGARDCIIYLDESIIFFDSKEKSAAGTDTKVRNAIFTSRHKNVSLGYGVQRPMSAMKDLRDVTDLFYQCKKSWVRHFKYIFVRSAYDLNSKGDDMNFDEPLGTKYYTGQKVFGKFTQYGARDLQTLK